MRVVALDALAAAFMQPIFDSWHIGPCRIRVIQECVAPQAKRSLGISRQILDIVRVIARGSVTVFALDALVRGPPDRPDIIVVTFDAGIPSLVFDRKLLPLLNVVEAMKVVREAVSMHAEIIRNKEHAAQEYETHQSDRYPQGVQYVPLHAYPSPAKGIRSIAMSGNTYNP